MVVVLPVPLTPATRMTNGFLARSISERLLDGLQHRGDFARQDRRAVRSREISAS